MQKSCYKLHDQAENRSAKSTLKEQELTQYKTLNITITIQYSSNSLNYDMIYALKIAIW